MENVCCLATLENKKWPQHMVQTESASHAEDCSYCIVLVLTLDKYMCLSTQSAPTMPHVPATGNGPEAMNLYLHHSSA